MKQLVTEAIVLSRTNFGEADRIITVLTPDAGKLKLVAKGVRKIKSRMAGGIELFSINDITYLKGKKDIGTLISSRLITNFGNIVTDVERTMYVYDVLKMVNKLTEDSPEPEYFDLLAELLSSVNSGLNLDLVKTWLYMHLLILGGHMPNLETDNNAAKLDGQHKYMFSYEDMAFAIHPSGNFSNNHIKILRLASNNNPAKLQKIDSIDKYLPELVLLTHSVLKQNTNL